ncbi:EpsG family protein [Bilifractor sp. LCP21S3_A7]|uniref:EpsG family protein n=1 Tax=Bilifractor sp. LCP21S3_A7 TaxID=3438738 RepID=UPI003F8EBD49
MMLGRVSSLIFYCIVIFVAIIFYDLYHNPGFMIKYGNHYSKKRAFLVISLGILSITFGFRWNVGTDFFNYYYNISENIFNITEPINGLLYFVGRISGNILLTFFLYILIELIVVNQALKIYFQNDWIGIVSGMTVYLFVFFPASLNTVRESFALSFLLLAYSAALSGDHNKLSLISFLVAVLIHNVTIIAFVGLLLIYWGYKNAKYVPWIYTIFVICLFGFALYLKNVSDINFFGQRLESYIGTSEIRFGLGVFIVNIPFAIYCYLLYQIDVTGKDWKVNRNTQAISVGVTAIIVRLLSYINFYYYRFANCFYILQVLLFGSAYDMILSSARKKKARYIVLLFCVLYFIYQYYIEKTGDIMNYQFKLKG